MRQGIWKYLSAAFNARPFGIFVPPNWIGMGVFALLGTFVNPGFLLLGAGLEALYLFGLATSDGFRRAIDGAELAAVRRETDRKLQSQLSKLPSAEQKRFNRLQVRCQEIIRNDGDSPEIEEIASGLERLLWLYLKMLRTAKQIEGVIIQDYEMAPLSQRIREYEEKLNGTLPPDLHTSIEGQLNTLRERLKSQTEARQRLEHVRSELLRIEDEVELVREKSALTENLAISAQVNAIATSLNTTNDWVKEQQDIFGSLTDELSDHHRPKLILER
jgi:hypothetical protein